MTMKVSVGSAEDGGNLRVRKISPTSSNEGDDSTKTKWSVPRRVGKKKKYGSLTSRIIMKFNSDRSFFFRIFALGCFLVVLNCISMASMNDYFSSPAEGCNQGSIKHISANVYNWCYKTDGFDFINMLLGRARAVRRVVSEEGNEFPKTDKQIIQMIDSHSHLNQEITAKNYDKICYADLSRLGARIGNEDIGIGPCYIKYAKKATPRAGSYEDNIDFFFFRQSDAVSYTDKLKCLNQCVDRVLIGPKSEDVLGEEEKGKDPPKQKPKKQVKLNQLQPNDKVVVDDVMLIEAAKAGMTFVAEKLLVKFGLNPLFRQIHGVPGSARSLNAIQEALRGGYAEMVAILTSGDNSLVIDEYGRTVEDYVRMNGSPIRPFDAKNVLGIHVKEGHHKLPKEKKHKIRKSGWNETTVYSYDKDRCDIDVVDGDLPPEVFYRDYFIPGRPVVLRGQVPEYELELFSRSHWKTNNDKFRPGKKFQVGPTAYPKLTDQHRCMKLFSVAELERGEVCKSMPDKPMVHAFHPNNADLKELYPGGNILGEKSGFRAIRNYFPIIKGRDEVNWQVFFGGDGSGATFHWHLAAFNILYVGIKEWTIAPPMYRGISGMTPEKVKSTVDEKFGLRCMQRPGDLIYIPNYWGHSTFNHGFSIGAAGIVKDHFQDGGTTPRGEDVHDYDYDYDYDYSESKKKKADPHASIMEKGGGPPFLFVHINKTGGTSLISMFSQRCKNEYWGGTWYDENNSFHRAFHATAHSYIEKYGRKAWDDAYTFSVVRHPLARQVSNFFFLVDGANQNRKLERLIPDLDLDSMSDAEKIEAFHEWIQKLYQAFPPGSPDHYRFGTAGHGNEVYNTFAATQKSWLVNSEGEMVVKGVFRLEDVSLNFSLLSNNIPCLQKGPQEMVKKNKTSKYPNYMLFANNDETNKIINEVYAEDFDLFHYDKL